MSQSFCVKGKKYVKYATKGKNISYDSNKYCWDSITALILMGFESPTLYRLVLYNKIQLQTGWVHFAR